MKKSRVARAQGEAALRIRCGLFLLLVCGFGLPLRAQVPRGVTAEEVQTAIDRGTRYLKSIQEDNGDWPDRPHYAGGLTPLCTLALLHCGFRPGDPSIDKAIAKMVRLEPNEVYTVSLQTMVLCYVDPKKYADFITRNVRWLEKRQYVAGENHGMWAIPERGSEDHTDNSMTHFAMLALYEAEKAGFAVSEGVWQRAGDYWRRAQNLDGSWGWSHGYPGTGSMTCAGIACLIIAAGQVGSGDALIEGEVLNCCGDQKDNREIQRAFIWLDRNFTLNGNPNWTFWRSYYHYSLERAGQLTSRRFIGGRDWYREGCEAVVRFQEASGAWPADRDFEHAEDPIVSTAFSLMFLAKGRRPVVVAHLQHLPKEGWNPHRGALANLTTHTGLTWKRELIHQIVDLKLASVEELLESPVLFMNGKSPPLLNDQGKQKLRMYIDRGGVLFAENVCGANFDKGFRELIAEIFPEQTIKLAPLPPTHPVWFSEFPIKPKKDQELWGIDVGCRTGVIYAPFDLSCRWEVHRPGRKSRIPPALLPGIEESTRLGVNVLSYATGREVKFRNPAAVAIAKPKEEGMRRGKLSVARIIHSGGCDSAPRAIAHLLHLVDEQREIPTIGEPVSILLSDEALFDQNLIVLSGRKRFTLSEIERAHLRLFVERGGTVFADAIGSSEEFASAFREEMSQIFPSQKLEAIPKDDPLFTAYYGGEEIGLVKRRVIERGDEKRASRVSQVTEPPKLEAITIEERYGVIFSPYDISCALDSGASLGFEGYSREDAARILLNVILYGLQK